MPLELLPDFRDTVVVVGTSARKNLAVLAAHLQSIDRQELPPRVRLVPVYVPDFTEQQQDARQHLLDWVKFRNGKILRGAPSQSGDYAEGPGLDSHQWTPSAMARVGYHKNLIIREALAMKADYVLFADTDTILDNTTVASLLSTEMPITTAVFWTKWSKRGTETRKVAAMPQVWVNNPYQLAGRGLEEGEFRKSLVDRQLVQVWGFGALTLVQRRVFEAGVDFSYLPDVSREGMMAGEDRHFSLRAERAHIPTYADAWPDIYHVYHDEDVARIPEMTGRLGGSHPSRATVGDLVSLRLRGLEPLHVGGGNFRPTPPEFARGRLGGLPLAPEIEDAVSKMQRGEKQIVRCHHPLHHPMPYMRGRIRLYEVTLIDTKPSSCLQPVLEDELFRTSTGAVIDKAALNNQQLESLAEVISA